MRVLGWMALAGLASAMAAAGVAVAPGGTRATASVTAGARAALADAGAAAATTDGTKARGGGTAGSCQRPAAAVGQAGAVTVATCAGIRSALVGRGGYDVSFPVVGGDCVPVASLSAAGPPAGAAPGEIAADPVPGQAGLYLVRTFDQSGAPANRAFQIELECAPTGDAGIVTIRYPASSAQVRVACEITRGAVVLATAQSGGPAVSWAGADSRRCRIVIHLVSVPKRGHPVRVAWQSLR